MGHFLHIMTQRSTQGITCYSVLEPLMRAHPIFYNTRSSTKVDLIAADDSMPHIVWNRYFLEEQGYGINVNILY